MQSAIQRFKAGYSFAVPFFLRSSPPASNGQSTCAIQRPFTNVWRNGPTSCQKKILAPLQSQLPSNIRTFVIPILFSLFKRDVQSFKGWWHQAPWTNLIVSTTQKFNQVRTSKEPQSRRNIAISCYAGHHSFTSILFLDEHATRTRRGTFCSYHFKGACCVCVWCGHVLIEWCALQSPLPLLPSSSTQSFLRQSFLALVPTNAPQPLLCPLPPSPAQCPLAQVGIKFLSNDFFDCDPFPNLLCSPPGKTGPGLIQALPTLHRSPSQQMEARDQTLLVHVIATVNCPAYRLIV